MRRKKPRLPALFGSALATAFLAVNIAGTPARAEAPVLAILAGGGTGTEQTPEPTQSPLLITADAEPEPLLAQAPKEQPKAPVPAAAPEQPAVPAPTQAAPSATAGVSPTLISDILGGAGGGSSGGGGAVNPASTTQGALSASQQAATGTSASTVGGGEAAVRATSDVGDLLGKSVSALGVWVIHRSPIITNPIVRGYHTGQYTIVADGGYWLPARQDLDTIVSKIDSSQIENVVIIKGPYSVRYGPGFAFIDVETLATPRYECGREFHGQSGLVYKSNGQQWFGLQSVWGGDENSGFRATYGIGIGTDYWDGDGVRQPSGFHTQTFNLDYGFDIGRYGKLEVKAIHLEQNDVKIPGAPLDISYLSTDAYVARFQYGDQDTGRFGTDVWYNYTRVTGNNLNGSKREQFPFLADPATFAPPGLFMTTEADLASFGYRSFLTLGAADSAQVTVGTDLRYIDTALNEFLFYIGFAGGIADSFPIPRSYALDPGLFVDVSLPIVEDSLEVKAGIRFDWVRTAVSNLDPQIPPVPAAAYIVGIPTSSFGQFFPPNIIARNYFFNQGNVALTGEQLQRDFALWSAFVTPEWKVNDNITLTSGIGMAQRPPTLTELYAIAPFTGFLQRGYNSMIGNPLLAPETLYQFDLGARLNYDTFRGGLNGYCSWVKNYITYEALPIPFFSPPFDGIVYQYTSTEALLWGTEAYVEYDINRSVTAFTTLAYVEGRDMDRGGRGFAATNPATGLPAGIIARDEEWLPGLPPLEMRAGVRWRDSRPNPRWGTELTARMVQGQNRVAETLQEYTTPGYTIFDVRGYWRPRDGMLLTAGIENFGDRQYREWADYRNVTGLGVFQPGLNAYVGMRLTY